MTHEYLVGELSVRLGQLQAAICADIRLLGASARLIDDE